MRSHINRRAQGRYPGRDHAVTDYAELEKRLHEAEATVAAWRDVFGGIEAHLQDRIAMGDEANPQCYLDIIRADIARVDASSKAMVASRWHDAKLAADALRLAERDTKRLDWLTAMVVNVRRGARYGSRDLFWSSPGEEGEPSDLRAQIDERLSRETAEQEKQP